MRGRELAIIFQNPRTALNPIRPVGQQIADVLLRHGNVTARRRLQGAPSTCWRRSAFPIRSGAPAPIRSSCPGGMCQRVMIAMALACEPQLLIADEPTTGLDITTQAVIMDLIAELAAAQHMATLLITHDLGLAAEYSDRIAVMHAGHIVETAPTRGAFRRAAPPLHGEADRGDAGRERRASTRSPRSPAALPDLRRADLPACRYSERCERVPR